MGAAVVRKLAADGYDVAVLSSSGKGEALANEFDGLGITGSNQSVGDLERLVEATIEHPAAAVNRLTSWALEAGVELDSLSMSQASLEDVYLALTEHDGEAQ